MGFRFSKSIKLFPGVRLNLSRRGLSASVGRPGATVNIRPGRVRATTGIPGTGLSYSTDVYRAGNEEGETSPSTEHIPPPEPGKTAGVSLLKRLFAKLAGRQ